MNGILYICGTPIGNLEDITLRSLRILNEVNIIAAEDTRHTLKLLNHFKIKTKMTSYHEHNKTEKGIILIKYLKEGKNIALVSDAGMPAISDPGEDLIKLCYEHNITVTAIPGPTAFTTGLILSGLDTKKFIFEGFLPSNNKARNKILGSLKEQTRTIIFYESPHHLKKTLKDIYESLGERKISIVREITKKHEQINLMMVSEAIEYYSKTEPKGEYVLVLNGASHKDIKNNNILKWETFSISEHHDFYLKQGIDNKTAMKNVAKDRGLTKRDVYSKLLK